MDVPHLLRTEEGAGGRLPGIQKASHQWLNYTCSLESKFKLFISARQLP